MCWNLFRLDKILPCFLARLYRNQILPGTLEELGVNLGKILANQNLTRQSWVFVQDTFKILGNMLVGKILTDEQHKTHNEEHKDCGPNQSNMSLILYHCNFQMLIAKHNLKMGFDDFPMADPCLNVHKKGSSLFYHGCRASQTLACDFYFDISILL